ncbi:MAG: BON domain-containing protein [Noviherbaspirillum sp.]
MKKAILFPILLSSLLVASCGSMPGDSTSGAKKESGPRSAGQVVDDSLITAKVKSALLADPDISGLRINVDTEKGVVTLKGEIKSMAPRKKAESLARGVEGVKAVNNQLIITG